MNRTHSLPLLLTIFFFITIGSHPTFAQEKFKFGKIDIGDLKMTRCPFDSAADAMILCEVGTSHYDGYELLFDRLLRIKIFTKKGFSEANQEIEYYYSDSENEKIDGLKGATYYLEGENMVEVKFGSENIFEEVQDKYTKLKKISFPAVREGCIIELKYTVRSPYIGSLRSWYFQGDIPVRWSEYEVRIPDYLIFSRFASGYYPFVLNERTDQTEAGGIHVSSERYATRDVPALKDEPFANTIQNYATKIKFELQSYRSGGIYHEVNSSWDVIVKYLADDEYFGKQLKKSGLVKDIVKEINLSAKSPVEKLKEAQAYIKTHFKWNGRSALYPSDNLRAAFEEHTGNSADINLALILLLKELDIDAVPVALSTWNHGMLVESVPTKRGLNYVIGLARIDSTDFLLDATSPSMPDNFLPRRCLNGNGIVIVPGPVRWVPLLGGEKDNQLMMADLKIDSTGGIQGHLEDSKSGYLAIDARESFKRSGEDAYSKELKQKIKSWEIDSIQYENIDKPDLALKIKYTLTSQEISQASGDMIYLNILSGLGQNSNPFNAEKRTFPVEFNCPLKDVYVFTYTIPAGFKIESLPESVKYSLPDQSASFKFIIGSNGNKIMVSSSLNITKTVFIPSEYELLKDFFTRIVAKHAQQIVLKKM